MHDAGQSMDHTNEPRLVFASKRESWHPPRMPLARVLVDRALALSGLPQISQLNA
jgi:hypothetical protein